MCSDLSSPNTISVGAGQTVILQEDTIDGNAVAAGTSWEAGGASVTMSWTGNTSPGSSAIMAWNINAAAGGGGGGAPILMRPGRLVAGEKLHLVRS